MDGVTKRLNELTEEAGKRMRLASYSPHQVYAEIMFMSDQEVRELHELKMMLSGDSSDNARDRIRKKILTRTRKFNHN